MINIKAEQSAFIVLTTNENQYFLFINQVPASPVNVNDGLTFLCVDPITYSPFITVTVYALCVFSAHRFDFSFLLL